MFDAGGIRIGNMSGLASILITGTLTTLILSKIVVTANDLLNNEYADLELASDLLAMDNELLTVVEDAWENKRFSSVWRMY